MPDVARWKGVIDENIPPVEQVRYVSSPNIANESNIHHRTTWNHLKKINKYFWIDAEEFILTVSSPKNIIEIQNPAISNTGS